MRLVKGRAPARIVQIFLEGKMTGLFWAVGLWLAAAQPAPAQTAKAEAIAGRWDMALADSNRKCGILLRAEQEAGGHALGMPAGCRRAMPILADVGAWAPAEKGRLDLEDRSGRPLLEFAPATDGELTAKGPGGESYTLVAANTGPQSATFAPVQAAESGSFEPVLTDGNGAAKEIAAANSPAPAPVGTFTGKPADVAGRYAILRAGGKDSGCMLTLDDKAHGPRDSLKAILAPGCGDSGMLIFDPVGWQIERGRMALVARKGHQTHLDQQPDGNWTKDPKEGAPLELKKL
jgi:hypothetical protein